MKKIILFILIFQMFLIIGVGAQNISLEAQNETYFYLLKKSGFDTDLIDNRYINGQNLSDILNILFMKEYSYELDNVGNVTGGQLFEILEKKLGFSVEIIENKEKISSRVLTFPAFFEIIDYYFQEITALNNLIKDTGTLAENNGSYFLTYGQGKTKEYASIDGFEMTDKTCEVELVKSGDEIIEIIPPVFDINTSMLYSKKEVLGALFLMYDKSIVISANGELQRYMLTDSFEILRRTDKDIQDRELVLFTGVYKKNSNLTTVAVERMN